MGATRSLANFMGERLKRKEEQNSLDSMVKLAQLRESGYDVEKAPSVFGGVFGGGYRGIRPSATAGQVPEGFVRVGGKVVQDPTYYNPGREREKAQIKSEEDVRAMSMFKNMTDSGNVPVGTTMRQGRFNIPMNPKVTGEEAAAISAEKQFGPMGEEIKRKTKEGVFNSPFGNVGRTFRQVAAGQPNALATFYDPKLQALQGNINSIRRYVFGEGGKQLTPYEANVVMALLNPKGKSDQQYQTDIDEALTMIKSKSALAKGGLNVATGNQTFGGGNQDIPSFNTPEEAEASGHKGEAIIAGRRARIE